ncbi:MAG: hypothetical protein LBN99_00935 [Oscillospiraceae bacterium]|jgi:hypothetical protein|nr:hypothetical protein [Oscillospiraceae bacterium]
MSEFSESWILRSKNNEDTRSILQKAGIGGYFATTDDWAIVLTEQERELLRAFPDIIIRYNFAENHGMWLNVFDGGTQIAEYSCEFEEMDEDDVASGINDSSISVADFAGILGCSEPDLSNALHPSTIEDAFEINRPFMALLGIPAEMYEWVSFNYAADRDDDTFTKI